MMVYPPREIRALGQRLGLLVEFDDELELGRVEGDRAYRKWLTDYDTTLDELDILVQRNNEFRELRRTQPRLNDVLQDRLDYPYGPWGRAPPSAREAEDFRRQREELRRSGDPRTARLPRDWRTVARVIGQRRRRTRHREPDELPRPRLQDELPHLEHPDIRDDELPVSVNLPVGENRHDDEPQELSEEDPRLPAPNTSHADPINLVDEQGFTMHRFKLLLSNPAPGTDILVRGKNALAKTKRAPNKETPFYEVIKAAKDRGIFQWVNEGPRGAIWAIDKGSEDVWAALREFNERMQGESLPWELLGVGEGICEGALYVLKPLVESE